MSGVVFALISAAIFGFQNAAARRGVLKATPLQGMGGAMGNPDAKVTDIQKLLQYEKSNVA